MSLLLSIGRLYVTLIHLASTLQCTLLTEYGCIYELANIVEIIMVDLSFYDVVITSLSNCKDNYNIFLAL